MNANEQDLVTADKYFDVEISGTWSSADTTAVTIHNYTTDATRYINIYTTGSARHDGTAYKSGAYTLGVGVSSSYAIVFQIHHNYTVIDGLVINMVNNGANGNCTALSFYNAGSYSIIKNSIIYLTKGTGYYGKSYVGISDDNKPITVYNCILFGWNNTVSGETPNYGIQISNSGTVVYGTTLYGNYIGLAGNGQVVKNILSQNINSDYSGTFSSSSTNNLSKDETAPAYGTYYINKTLTFTNTTAGSEDFHLVAGDTDAIDKGADLSGTFTTDIDGTTRSGTWDIGADEYVAASSGVPMSTTWRITGMKINGMKFK
jgi:hypothetical protein